MAFAQDPCKTHEERIARMMTDHGRELKRLCYLYLRDRALAEDAAQETFLKAYKALPGFRGQSSEKTWLTRIAVNTCRDMLRTFWFRRVDRKVDFDTLPEQAAEDPDGDDTVLQAILALPRKYREVIVLRYYQEMDIADIAAALGAPAGTVKSRLSRARNTLSKTLERWYFDEE